MCGLVGVAGDLNIADRTNFKTLLYISISRGRDSTGVAAIGTQKGVKKERIEIVKEAVPSYQYIEIENRKRWSLVFDRYDADILMGHVRWATVGRVDRHNAHPFSKKHLIGAHNGTLLNPEFHDKSGKTDSELMFEKMDAEGIVDTLEELSPKSAYAVTIFEKGSRKLYFSRNTLRSLWVGIHKSRDVIYWASEQRFLDFLEEDMDIYYFSPYRVYEVDLSDIKAGNAAPWNVYKLSDKSKETDPYEGKKSVVAYGGAYGDYYDWYDDDEYKAYRVQPENQSANVTTLRRTKTESSSQTSNLFEDPSFIDSEAGDWEQFLDQTDDHLNTYPFDIQCSSCDEIILPEDVERSKVFFEGATVCVCDKCRSFLDETYGTDQDDKDGKDVGVQTN